MPPTITLQSIKHRRLLEAIVMTDKIASKLGRSLCIGIAAATVFTSFSSPENVRSKSLSLLFPQFIMGVSTEKTEHNDERVVVEEEPEEREYSFKIVELLQKLFD